MATPASRSAMHRRRSTLAALGLLLTLAAPAMGQGAPAAAAAAAAASVGAAKAPSNATGNVTVAAAGVVTPMIIGGLAAPTNRCALRGTPDQSKGLQAPHHHHVPLYTPKRPAAGGRQPGDTLNHVTSKHHAVAIAHDHTLLTAAAARQPRPTH